MKPYLISLGAGMFVGILPWTWFSSSLTEAANSLMAGGNLIKKVLFPAEILPIVSVLANMMHFFFGLPILLAFLVYFRPTITFVELLWFPVVVAVQLLFTLGLSLLLAVVGGTLRLKFGNGFKPAAGSSYAVLTAGAETTGSSCLPLSTRRR